MTLQGTYNDRGFTFVELLTTLALISLLVAAATPIYTRLQRSAQLNENASELVQTLRTARTRAVARVRDAAHGVHLQSSQYTLYQGASYASRDTTYDRVITLDSALTLSETLSGSEVNFSRGLGTPSATGTITLTHDVQGTTTITVDSLGSVQQ